MNRFQRWGLSALTMMSVATVVLLVTGWGSAIAATAQSVIVANPASNPAQIHETNTDTNGNIKVHEQGTANVNVTNKDALAVSGTVNVGNLPNTQPVSGTVSVGNLPATQPVSGTVNIGNLPANFPAAPTTDVILNTRVHLGPKMAASIFDKTDTRAYRSVTIYVHLSFASGEGQICLVRTFDPAGHEYRLEQFETGSSTQFIKTYDPAPPNLDLECGDITGNVDGVDYDVMLTGRTG